jgi:hypothetical protein
MSNVKSFLENFGDKVNALLTEDLEGKTDDEKVAFLQEILPMLIDFSSHLLGQTVLKTIALIPQERREEALPMIFEQIKHNLFSQIEEAHTDSLLKKLVTDLMEKTNEED